MAKKTFKSNPAMSFISQETIEKVDGAPVEKGSAANEKKAPEGYKVNPEFIEKKSRRVQILIQPSVYEAVRVKAQADGISVNEAINTAIRNYVEG